MPASTCTVDEVIVEPEPSEVRKLPAETEALLALSHTVARAPDAAIQRLVEAAMKLTGAGSAGVSLEDTEGGEAVFRWVAMAGEFARYLHGTMPRDVSPCGAVLDRGRTLVMQRPVRHYASIGDLHAPVESALLVPFGRAGRPVGTVWVLEHTSARRFTQQDVRVVEGLTTFATALLDAMRRRQNKRAPAR